MIMKPFQLLVSILAAVSLQAGPMPDAEFIDNGVIRLGIDRSAGGSIFHFGPSGEGSQNLLNHFDKGRFIQQSYYGRVDGSEWAGKPWRWNPVQGGGYRGEAAEEVVTERDGETLRVVSKPRHWATGERVDEAEMQSVITLRGPVAAIEFLFRYKGDEDHPLQHQELPAVFVDAEYSNLVYIAEGVLQRKVPGWPNERIDAEESWAAYLNDADEGIGVLFPETTEVTCYRYEGDGKTGPTGSACSYFAPVRTFAVTPDLEFGYKVYLTIGSLEEIRERFGRIAEK
jgi:hypothetical protein